MTRAPIVRAFLGDEAIGQRDHQGRFVAGRRASTATEFQPGERRSKATEFKPGRPAGNRMPLGAVTVRIEANTGRPRAWVKVQEPNVWRKRAVVAWEQTNGPLPAGHVVHHRDRNSLNDEPENLSALSRAQHTDEHRLELAEALVYALRTRRAA